MYALLAIAALGVLPAAASAKTVLADASGNALPIGANIYAKSTNFGMAGYGAACESIDLTGKVTANSSNPASIEIQSTASANCQTNTGVGLKFKTMPFGPFSFFEDGSMTAGTPGVWNWDLYLGSTFWKNCSNTPSGAEAAWGGEYPEGIAFEYEMTFGSGACGSLGVGTGQFSLSEDAAGEEPVHIEVQ